MEILNKHPGVNLKVYSIWFNMYPGDDRSKWNNTLLSDSRVTQFWDENKIVGRWMVDQKVVDYPRQILWDAYLLFGPEAEWQDTPSPLISWGMPVYHRRHKLMNDLLPLLEAEATAAVTDIEQPEPAVMVPQVHRGPEEFDLIVIGSGSGGLAAAIRGAELGKRVAVIEASTIGGTCINVGCIPSKALLQAAELYHLAGHHPFRGMPITSTGLDWGAVFQQKNELVSEMRKSRYEDVLDAYPEITLIRGWAKLMSGTRVEVKDVNNNESETLHYAPDKIIIATGAHPWAPPIEGLEGAGYLDSTSALELMTRPASMIVVGGGSIGLEIAQAYARLGTKVTVLEIQEDIIPEEESEIAGKLTDYLREEGLIIETNISIRQVRKDERGYQVISENMNVTREFNAEILLMATGRRANTSGMGLDEAGVNLGIDGEIIVDDYLQTSNANVYAAGDVTGRDMYVYVSGYSGKLAAENAINGNSRTYDTDILPRVIFTDPAVASVGMTEEQAYDERHEVKVTTLPLEYISRAKVNRDTRGLIKLVADKSTDRLLGAHVLAPEAGEVIQAAAVAIKAAMTIKDIQDIFFPYLTMSEGLKLAAQSFDKDPALLSCCAG
jgi:mercuric reductase